MTFATKKKRISYPELTNKELKEGASTPYDFGITEYKVGAKYNNKVETWEKKKVYGKKYKQGML